MTTDPSAVLQDAFASREEKTYTDLLAQLSDAFLDVNAWVCMGKLDGDERRSFASLGDTIAFLASVRNLLGRVESIAVMLREEERRVELDILGRMEREGLKSTTHGNLRVSLRDKWVANYDPEKWQDICAAFVALGRCDLIQRRLNESRIMELVDSGSPLPDGVTVQALKRLEVRKA